MSAATKGVVVIGAGIGGLVAALELAHAGQEVTVLDRAEGPGGKMRTIPSHAGPVEAGPTVFTLRHVFDALFDAVGESLDAHLALSPLEVLARHHWRRGPSLDLHANHSRSRDAIGAFAGARAAAEFDAFSARARRLFDALERPVMATPGPTPLSVARATLGQAPRLIADLAPLRSFARLLEREFTDPRLRQLFGRYATYVGGCPFRSPAVLALIWRAEAAGVWQVHGGMHRLARALESLCTARGVTFRYGCHAERIGLDGGRAGHVVLAGGERLDAGAVLFNGDPAALAEGLLGPGATGAASRRPRPRRSLSAWVWSFAAEPGDAPLTHHNVCFSDDSRAEFDALFARRRLPPDPTLYLCAQDRGGAAAPGGAERFQIIMNAPADGDAAPPGEEEIARCKTRVFHRLAEAGLTLTPPASRRALTTPADFARLFPGTAGAIYGTAPHALNATFRRPWARTRVPGLYLAGGAAHPGPGVPMAALSGRMAAAAILADRASTFASRRTAMPGGTSTVSRTTASAASRSSVS